ncbi:hypothetical protein ACWIGM_00595 [Bosea sp. NPDC055332]
MSEALQGREASIRGGRLLWGPLALTFAALAAAILYEGEREMREDRIAHELCREQADDLVGAAVCSCILEREDGLVQHALVMLAPSGWRELWHQATRNECSAETYTRIVTERGIQAVRPRPLPGVEGGSSP